MNTVIRIRKPKINRRELLVATIFISYFCSEAFRSLLAQVGGSSLYDAAYNCFFVVCLILYATIYKGKKLYSSIICYSIIALLFIVTIVIHPEYEEWYFDRVYGIQVQFFRAVGGIWAFLVVSLEKDREEMLRHLRLAAWILFIYLSFKFAAAQVRGYWIGYDNEYRQIKDTYNLGFGYEMLFPVLFFGAEGFLNRKKLNYIPFAIGTFEILFGGSRGAIVWIPFAFLLMIPYSWKSMTKKQRSITSLLIMVSLPLAYLIFVHYTEILNAISNYLIRTGHASRTVLMLLSGDFAEGNGRDLIYRMVFDRIREGGWIGNGVFGERIVVGQRFRWGYAHNLFLEIYAAFGYLGGTAVSLWLILEVVKTARRCKTTADQIVFITFLCTSMKLMLSDSFWYNRAFWALLAIMAAWKKQTSHKNEQFEAIQLGSSMIVGR